MDQFNQEADGRGSEGVTHSVAARAEQQAAPTQSTDAAMTAIVQAFNDNFAPIRQVFQAARRGLDDLAKTFQPVIQKIHEAQKQSAAAEVLGRSLEQAGWFPHGTIPLSIVTNGDFDATIPVWIDANAGKDWSSITKVHNLDTIDRSAKDSFATAVALYEEGRYNAALRVIFPEIEACAFEAFYMGLGISWRGKRPTGLRELRDIIKLLWGIGAFGALFDARGVWLPQQEQIIRDFCYTDVDLANILPAQRHFPNRHVVAHGLFRYDSKKACINGLLIADVMLRGIHAANVIFQKSPADATHILEHLDDRRRGSPSKIGFDAP